MNRDVTIVGKQGVFPPEGFKMENQDFSILGISNKDNLIPKNLPPEMQMAALDGKLDQFIAIDRKTGDVYEAFIYMANGAIEIGRVEKFK